MIRTLPKTQKPPRSSLAWTVLQIAELPQVAKEQLRASVTNDDGFAISAEALSRLAADLGLPRLDTVACLRALEGYYDFLNDRPNGEQQLDALVGSLDRLDALTNHVADVREVAEAILPLVEPSDRIEKSRKLQRLREGQLPNAVGFMTFVDLRPNFSRQAGDVGAVTEYVRQIQFVVATDSANPALETITLQLDNQGLESLREAVKTLDAKIAVLEKLPLQVPLK